MSVPLKSPAPKYQIDYVDRVSTLPVFTYDRVARTFTATAYAAGRASIEASGEFTVFSLAGTEAMTIDAAGIVRAKELLFRQKPARTQRRLEFIRKASSVKQVIGYLTEQGQLCSWQMIQGAVPNSTDQMLFKGGAWLSDSLMGSLNLPMPIATLPYGSLHLEDSVDTVVPGTTGQTYSLALRFHGGMETRNYINGASSGQSSYFYASEAEQPLSNPRNIWRLTISNPSQTYYLNHQEALQSLAFDYTITGIQAVAGATVTLYYNTVDMLQLGYQEMTVDCLSKSPVLGYTSDVGFGPKGLIAQGFRETDDLLESYHLLTPPGADHLLTPDGRYLEFPH